MGRRKNSTRLEDAFRALSAYRFVSNDEDKRDRITDLLTDLLHIAVEGGGDPLAHIRLCVDHFCAEGGRFPPLTVGVPSHADDLVEYRVTFPGRYGPGCPGHTDPSARQGNYVRAVSPQHAANQIALRDHTYAEMDVQRWDHGVVYAPAERLTPYGG